MHSIAGPLLARNWFIFPVRDRRPLTPHGHKDASRDPEQVAEWSDQFPGCSWGIDLERSGLVVLDVDVKEGKPGMESLEQIVHELPETLAAMTPSGGMHFYFTRPPGWKPRRVIGWKPGLDLLSKGVLFAYETDEVGMAEAPRCLAGASELPQERPERVGGTPATPEVLKAAERWLRAHGPAVEGMGGNGHTVSAVTRLLWDYDLPAEEAWPLLAAWNESCDPPWGEEELAYKLEHLHEGESPRGMARLALAAKPKQKPAKSGRVVEFVGEIIRRAKRPWLKTPWPRLDAAVGGGLQVGGVTVVAAGTGTGKTAFAAQIGARWSEERGVVYYMGELDGSVLAARVVAQRRRVPWGDVLRGQVPEAEMRRILAPLDLRVVERCDDPTEAIGAHLEGASALVVDYAQLLADWDDPRGPRASITQAVRWLLRLAEERSLVVVVLSQTSRLVASTLRADHELRAADFVGAGAESSALEHDADNVLALRLRGEDGEAEAMVAKARFRGPSTVPMTFHGASGVWEELDPAKADDRKREKQVRQDEADEAALMAAVDRYPHFGSVQLLKEVHLTGRDGTDRAYAARERLIKKGVLELIQVGKKTICRRLS